VVPSECRDGRFSRILWIIRARVIPSYTRNGVCAEDERLGFDLTELHHSMSGKLDLELSLVRKALPARVVEYALFEGLTEERVIIRR